MVLGCRPEGSELKPTGFCQWSAPNRVVYQPGGRGVPAGTSARVEWQTSGASLWERLVCLCCCSLTCLLEVLATALSVSSDDDGGLHLTASLRWGTKKKTKLVCA